MRLIDADAMLLRVDLIGTNKFGMLDEDIREFISEQPTVDIEPMLPFDWSKVPVDTPILVRDSQDDEWLRRHFAKFEDGVVYTWDDGRTSWSLSSLGKVDWKYAKLAEESNG